MKTLISICVGLTVLSASSSRAMAGDLEKLAGKWSVARTNDQGEAYTQIIEVQKEKFTFKIVGSAGDVRLYAEGELKLEKLGPFNVARFTRIKAGQSANETEPVEDDRAVVYQLGYDTWAIASNFDKEREQKPHVDVYRKVTSDK